MVSLLEMKLESLAFLIVEDVWIDAIELIKVGDAVAAWLVGPSRPIGAVASSVFEPWVSK